MQHHPATICLLMAMALGQAATASAQASAGFNFERVARDPAVVGTVQTCDVIDAGAVAPVNDVVRRALAATGSPHPEFTHFVNVRCRSAEGVSYVNVFFAASAAAQDFATRLATPTPIRVRVIGSASRLALGVVGE